MYKIEIQKVIQITSGQVSTPLCLPAMQSPVSVSCFSFWKRHKPIANKSSKPTHIESWLMKHCFGYLWEESGMFFRNAEMQNPTNKHRKEMY